MNLYKIPHAGSTSLFTSAEVGTPQYMAPEAGKRERIVNIAEVGRLRLHHFDSYSMYVHMYIITVSLYRRRLWPLHESLQRPPARTVVIFWPSVMQKQRRHCDSNGSLLFSYGFLFNESKWICLMNMLIGKNEIMNVAKHCIISCILYLQQRHVI